MNFEIRATLYLYDENLILKLSFDLLEIIILFIYYDNYNSF